jgi:hypothetical protein
MQGTTFQNFQMPNRHKELYAFRNTKRKIYKTNAAIWFNKLCRERQITPGYICIKINGSKQQDKNTLKMATRHRLGQEIKFLHLKKTKLNQLLYTLHLECAKIWNSYWQPIYDTVNSSLQTEMESHYERLNKKLDRLLNEQKGHTTYTNKTRQQRFYPRTVNLTNIQFTKEEMDLLNMGLQHNLQKFSTSTWTKLAIETEQAIRLLDDSLQDTFRFAAAKKLKQISNINSSNLLHKRQTHTLKSIQQKIHKNNAMITRADKGKTTVIIHTQDYNNKVYAFLTENNFQPLPQDPTSKDQTLIHKTLQQCDQIINKKQIKHLIQKTPTPPSLNALLKLHKPEIPIRPVVNNIGAPSYKPAKKLNKILNTHLHLNYHYTSTNSTALANELTKLKINSNHRLMTMDIKDLYVNIPIDETIKITKTLLAKHNDEKTTYQITTLLETILRQNYFVFQDHIYQPDKGVAMGSPLSSTIAETFLQHIEEAILKQLLDTNCILYYARYVDDILLIYDHTQTTYESILTFTNNLHKNLQLIPNPEMDGQVNFLDLLISRKPKHLEIDIFRKPTTTNTTINFLSNHPMEHKMSAYRFHLERMYSLPLNQIQRQNEWETILQIANSNNFPTSILQRIKERILQQLSQPTTQRKKMKKNTKWTTFTFTTPHIRKITNLFKNTDIKIAFKTNNTLRQLTKPSAHTPTPPQECSGIYGLTCNTCQMTYVGQTSRNLTTRYKEHIRYIRSNDPKSAYALHILQNRHEYGPMNETMHLLKRINNTTSLIPYERLYIQTLHQAGKLISEQFPGDPNPLFQAVIYPHTTPPFQ